MFCWVVSSLDQGIKVNDYRQANSESPCKTEVVFLYPHTTQSIEAYDILDIFYYNRHQDSPTPHPVKDADEIDAILSLYQADMTTSYYDNKFKALREDVA